MTQRRLQEVNTRKPTHPTVKKLEAPLITTAAVVTVWKGTFQRVMLVFTIKISAMGISLTWSTTLAGLDNINSERDVSAYCVKSVIVEQVRVVT